MWTDQKTSLHLCQSCSRRLTLAVQDNACVMCFLSWQVLIQASRRMRVKFLLVWTLGIQNASKNLIMMHDWRALPMLSFWSSKTLWKQMKFCHYYTTASISCCAVTTCPSETVQAAAWVASCVMLYSGVEWRTRDFMCSSWSACYRLAEKLSLQRRRYIIVTYVSFCLEPVIYPVAVNYNPLQTMPGYQIFYVSKAQFVRECIKK